jgi:hypothetical protein
LRKKVLLKDSNIATSGLAPASPAVLLTPTASLQLRDAWTLIQLECRLVKRGQTLRPIA